jgi:hypothetical protein
MVYVELKTCCGFACVVEFVAKKKTGMCHFGSLIKKGNIDVNFCFYPPLIN